MNEVVKIAAGYILICLLWGSTWLFIKMGLDSLSPMFSAGIRFLLASVFIYTLMKIRKVAIVKGKTAVILYFVIGIFSFGVPFYLVYWAEQQIASGLASVLFAAFPFFVLITSRLMLPGHKFDLYKLSGIIIGFSGILVIFSKNININLDQDFYAMIAVLGSAFIQGIVAVTVKKYGAELNPLSMNFFPTIIAGVFLTLSGFLIEDFSVLVFDTNAIISLLYLGLFGTVFTFTTYYWLLKRINVVLLSLSAFITPVVALVLGWIVLGEVFSSSDLAGASLVLAGILLANMTGLIKYVNTNFRLKKA
ncbi:MAG: hypothetical protein SCALA702_08200 [Melioribacteraceae bacterium]|nr:MAG: hypothetical protein SCALA702_08200 [Melioribacteraceae bacterium]